jgi:4-hydroxybenzoate polyprenyltransferase
VAFALVHSAITIWNDLEDQAVDELNGIHDLATYRRLGWYRYVVMAVWLMVVAAALLALWLPYAIAVWLAVVGAMGWIYNARPVQASRRPVASMAILALCYGFVPVAIGISLGPGTVPAAAWLLAAGWTAGRLSLSLLKDYKDARGDAAAAKKTFLLVYGGRWVARSSFWLAVVGFAGCLGAFAWLAPDPGRIVLLGVVAGWLVLERRRLFLQHTYAELNGVFHRCLHYQLAFDGLMVVCLITL